MTAFPTLSLASVPVLSLDQAHEVDRRMEAEYGILPLQRVENAGRSLADLAQAWLGDSFPGASVLVLAGAGDTGGAGLAAARHLANRGADAQVVLAAAFEALDALPDHQLRSLLAMGVSVTPAGDGWELPSADLVLDALIGYDPWVPPPGETAAIIRLANSHPAAILSLGVPSGLDAATGHPGTPCIHAAATLALALPTTGLVAGLPGLTGDLYLADVSVPASLYEGLGLEMPTVFQGGPLVRLAPMDQPT